MKKTRFRGFTLWYSNQDAMESMCREAEAFSAFFAPRSEEALILDCGSNIGISMLEWKSRWPYATVVCFEPDPNAFALLQRNVEENDIPGVSYHNIALSDVAGESMFFGDLNASGDARGNSLESHWANRPGTSSQLVRCDCLSKYIDQRRVDFLKLDVEGSELRVLREIRNQLHWIDAMYVEVHETQDTAADASAEQIENWIREAGFTVEHEGRAAEYALPARLRRWQDEVRARQSQLLCWKPIP